MAGFAKLHGSILDSSIWGEDMATRLVWITMLAMANHEGVVEASVGGLAHRARVPRAETERALAILAGPDPDSRDGTTGERIESVPGGWLILNHGRYRDHRTPEQIATAERVARHRAKLRAEKKGVTRNVTSRCNAVKRSDTLGHARTPPEAETESEAEKRSPTETPAAQERGPRCVQDKTSSNGASEPARARRASKANPVNVAFATWWEEAWLEQRGEAWAWDAKQRAAVDRARRKAADDLEAMTCRARHMLDSQDAWVVQNAAPSLLASRWNELAVQVRRRKPPRERSAVDELEDFFRERDARESGA